MIFFSNLLPLLNFYLLPLDGFGSWNTFNKTAQILATRAINTTTTTTVVASSTQPSPFTVFVEVVCIIIFIFGIFGNSLVLLVFGFKWNQLKVGITLLILYLETR